MPRPDLYATLGVGRHASAAQIKQAYRAAALRDHPDKCPGDRAAEERFKQAAHAYAILSDPAKKKRYDLFGSTGEGPDAFDPQHLAEQLRELFGDVFGDVFGGLLGRGPAPAPELAVRELALYVPFAVAATGGSLPLSFARQEPCCACHGKGCQPEGPERRCEDCGGGGSWSLRQGIFALKKRCRRCGGSGRLRPPPCVACHGTGAATLQCTLQVAVPAGADTGTLVVLPHAGDYALPAAKAGTLRVHCQVEAPTDFVRQGANLRQTITLSPAQAALGCTLPIPRLGGQAQLRVPSGTQPGTLLRLRGEGLPDPNAAPAGRRGDLLVEVAIHIPTQLSAAQRQLWDQLAALKMQ